MRIIAYLAMQMERIFNTSITQCGMTVRDLYTLFTQYTTLALNWWISVFCQGYAVFNLSVKNLFNQGYSIQILGLILIPFGTVITAILGLINSFLQYTVSWANFFLYNIDIFNYLALTTLYSLILFFFVIKYLSLSLQIFALLLPLVPICVYLNYLWRSSQNPASDATNAILNFFDYWYSNPVPTTYLICLIVYCIFLGISAQSIIESGTIVIGAYVILTFLIFYPLLTVFVKCVLGGQDFQTTVDATVQYIQGIFVKKT